MSEAAAAQQAAEGAARGNAVAGAAEQEHQPEERGAAVAAGGCRGPPAPRTASKGWSAFTLFGLEARHAVRAESPRASAADIEKVASRSASGSELFERGHRATVSATAPLWALMVIRR